MDMWLEVLLLKNMTKSFKMYGLLDFLLCFHFLFCWDHSLIQLIFIRSC